MYLRRLRDLREDHDLKQEYVARVLKITRQQYQLYESGKRSLPIDKLIEICRLHSRTKKRPVILYLYILLLINDLNIFPLFRY